MFLNMCFTVWSHVSHLACLSCFWYNSWKTLYHGLYPHLSDIPTYLKAYTLPCTHVLHYVSNGSMCILHFHSLHSFMMKPFELFSDSTPCISEKQCITDFFPPAPDASLSSSHSVVRGKSSAGMWVFEIEPGQTLRDNFITNTCII